MESRILDQFGNPIKKKALVKEFAAPSITGVRQAWQVDSVASALTPVRLAQVLQSANEGNDYDAMTLAEEMEEKEPHYGSVLGTRKRAVDGLDIVVESASEDKADEAIAEAVRQQTQRPEFEEMISDLLDGLGKGRSTVEMLWDTSESQWQADFIWRDPRYFILNPENAHELRLRDEADLYKGVALPAYKFITHIPKLKTGIPTRAGLWRLSVVSYMCKSFTLRDWMSFSELFGLPIRVGRYGQGAKDGDIAILRNAVANIGSDAAAVIPETMRIEFIERAGGAGSGHQFFKDLAEWLDKQVSKAVLGQTATTEGTAGKLGADKEQGEVRQDILKADAKQLARTLNRDFVRPFVDLNFGVQKAYPKVSLFVPDNEDLKLLIDAVQGLVPMGLKVKQSEIRDKLNISDPDDDDELLQIPSSKQATQTVQTAQNHVCPHCATHHTALNREDNTADEIDALSDEALQDWQPVMQPMLDPIQQLAEDSADEQEFLARLPELLDTMDANALIQALATQTFKTRGLGNGG